MTPRNKSNGRLEATVARLKPMVETASSELGPMGRPILKPEEAVLPRLPEGASIARLIDHTLLKTEYTPADVERTCDEALTYSFASVCVNPIHIPQVVRHLDGSQVKPASVVGFTFGAEFPDIKVAQAERLIAAGARELDMVLAVGLLRAGQFRPVIEDLLGVVKTCHAAKVPIKVIIESGLLTFEEKVAAALIVAHVGADYVKTCTGFAPGEATEEDIRLLRQVVGSKIGVKAAGGVRSLAKAQAVLAAGASRIGATQGVAIVEQASGRDR